jgi:AcrR family transcriptional regulator
MESSEVKRSSRDVILSETIRLFSERGYSSTSMRDIANAVGLLPGSLYVHISGKEQLLGDIVESGIDRFLAACKPALESDEPADVRMRAAMRAHMQIVGEDAEHMLVALHQWKYLTGDRLEIVVNKRREYEAIFTTIVGDGIKSGDFSKDINPRIAVLTIIGTLNWTPEWFSPKGPESAEQVADEIADVLLCGLVRGPD